MAHGHVQGAGDGCGGQGEQIDLSTQGLQFFFLVDPEAVLFIDNHQPQVLEVDIALQQLVGADDDVSLARLKALQGSMGLLAGAEAAEQLDLHRGIREPVSKRLEVLLG